MSLLIGVDLGGTKIEIVAMDKNGTEFLRKRKKTPRNSYIGTISAIVDLVKNAEKELDNIGTLGICLPVTISPRTKLIKNSNLPWLIGKPFSKDIEKALNRPVKVANDADCLALSEAFDGNASDKKTVWGIVLGNSSGGGLVIDKKIISGPNAITGEWGHNPLPWMSDEEWSKRTACYCGKQGCIDTFISGNGLSRNHKTSTGQILSAKEISEKAEKGDMEAEKSLQKYEDRLARATAMMINILDPDMIILGGGLSNIKRLYTSLPKLWSKYVFSDVVETKIKPAKHGDASGVRGAALLWVDDENITLIEEGKKDKELKLA